MNNKEIDCLVSLMAKESFTFNDLRKFKNLDLDQLNSYGRTPLMQASDLGLFDVSEFLLNKGASVGVTGTQGLSALHHAASNGHTEIVMLLVEHGADVNIKSDMGVTPLMCAAAWGHLETVKTLIALGSDKDIIDNIGVTASDIAYEKGEDEIGNFLMRTQGI